MVDAIQPGKTYRLMKTLTNPKPDRRKKHDWRALETLSKGTLFYGDIEYALLDAPKGRASRVRIWAGRWSSHSIGAKHERYAEIVAALEPVEDFASFVRELLELYSITAEDLLEILCEGTYTITHDRQWRLMRHTLVSREALRGLAADAQERREAKEPVEE